jgi:WD40 repeat protein
LVAGDNNGVLWSWRVENEDYRLSNALQAHRDAIYATTFSTKGRLVTGAGDGSLYLWEAGPPDPGSRIQLRGALGEIQSVAISEAGRRLVAGTIDNIHI